ncbi:Na+/phosphate symporter [Salirhabdus euzebyi]|uniref:Na+/phosphate symporter n=1 Tax=Salirhabdus euzebyi TaxID=394506 RepID=A0A841Q8H8_9BACI|nr:DUF6407 family protein [Salirhabdus euzebyi]MBB6454919.1 Na+/phosphate symporter [Salirhabdus euzebyi]
MNKKSSFDQFVQQRILEKKNYNSHNYQDIKDIIKQGIHYYQLNSAEKLHDTEEGKKEVLYIHSMMEENILSKIATLASNNDGEINIEAIYEGYIVRNY